jgi:membrane fusion protein (multidrug efflux system)
VNQDASTAIRGSSGATSSLAKIRWAALAAVILATIVGAFLYWRHSELYPSTENAYTGSNIVRVAPQVSGPVVHVYVETDEHVNAGDPLFDIDPVLYDAALRNARAQFDAAAAASGTAADALKAAANTLDEKRKGLGDALAAYRKAKDAEKPDQPPSDALQTAEKAWQDALKAYNDAADAFSKEQDKEITVTTPTVQMRAAAAGLDKASRDRVKTHILASTSGSVSSVTLRPGATVGAGTPLFAIIEGNPWWVDANFKETDLARVKQGQPGTVRLDMYPGTTFEGVVDSISAGSGATFSVLPAENATGNWVKVTQRFPVRIRFVNLPENKPLRVGASATVTIDTTQGGK